MVIVDNYKNKIGGKTLDISLKIIYQHAVTVLWCISTFRGLIDNNLALKFAINNQYIPKNLQFPTIQNSQCLVETAGAGMRYYTCTNIYI